MVECVPEVNEESHVGARRRGSLGFALQSYRLLQAQVHVEVTRSAPRIAFGSCGPIVDGRVAVVIVSCGDVIGTIRIRLHVRVDADVPKCAEAYTRDETVALIEGGAVPLVPHIVI